MRRHPCCPASLGTPNWEMSFQVVIADEPIGTLDLWVLQCLGGGGCQAVS